jgi:hypothetical protein
MATYWVDPYVYSSNGGIHGTVTVGSGTYASPWSPANITVAGNLTVLLDGDEIRIKGLPESEFFEATSNAYTSLGNVTLGGVQYTHTYNRTSAHNNKFARAQASDSELVYFVFDNSSQSLLTTYSASTWYAGFPTMNVAYGYFLLKDRFTLNNTTLGTTNRTLFNNTTANITITAGWTSETVQDGVTIWYANQSSVLGSTQTWGPSSQWIDFECANLIIGCPDSINININSNSAKFKSLAASSYAVSAGRFNNIVAGRSTGSHKSNAGNLFIDQFMAGGTASTTITPRASATNFDHRVQIPYYIGGQSATNIQASRPATTNNILTTITLTKGYGNATPININSNQSLNQGNLKIKLNDNYEFISTASPSLSMSVGGAPANFLEEIGIPKNTPPYPSGILYNIIGGFSTTPSNDQNYLGPQVGNIIADYRSEFKKPLISSVYKTAIRNLVIESPGETSLETLTAVPGIFTQVPIYGSPRKVNIFNETQQYKPLQLMSPTIRGPAAVIYNSANFSNKLTWKILGRANGFVYADTYALPLPSYASNNISFSTTFDTNTDPGANIIVRLYGFSQTQSNVIPLANVTGVAIGNVVYANIILTSANLATSAITSLYGVVDVQKTTTANAEIAFNPMIVSQV